MNRYIRSLLFFSESNYTYIKKFAKTKSVEELGEAVMSNYKGGASNCNLFSICFHYQYSSEAKKLITLL